LTFTSARAAMGSARHSVITKPIAQVLFISQPPFSLRF
jgi:hypothetical protein